MRSLTEIFAPGAPTLPEGLRTLVVSPERELEPGMTVRATFTFSNQGGAPASGVRVRFNLPEGLVYLVGSGQLDGLDLDDDLGNSPLLARSGAGVGEVAPGQERRIEIAYSVAGAIENGSTVELQAAVAAFDLAPVGSNVVRLVARSRPLLQNALTTVSIETPREARPGGEAQITVRVHNAGESSAHDVVVVAPSPERTTYLANSARVNGREIEREFGMAFDRLHAPIIVATLAASATATLTYRVRIDDPLPDQTRLMAAAQIASQETSAFDVQPALLLVGSRPDFSDDRTLLSVDPAQDVRPGERVALRVVAFNSGTASAENVTVTLGFSEGLHAVRGATRIDGKPLRERKRDALSFDLGTLDARTGVELRAEAVVASPLTNASEVQACANLTWSAAGAEHRRTFEQVIVIRSEPYCAPRRNLIERIGPERAVPAEEVEATLLLANDGSADATDALLRLRIDPALDDVRITEKSARLRFDGETVDLGSIEPYASRRLSIRARVRTPYPDRTEVRILASLQTRELGETPLGEAQWVVNSRPAFDARRSRIEIAQDAVLRPNQSVSAQVTVVNEGTDIAQDVRVRLYVSPEARLESVEGATRDRSSLVFGEIAPGASAQAQLSLRLLRSLAKDYPVTIDGVLTAQATLPLPLARLTIATAAEPDFAVGTLRSEPAESVDVGEHVEWVLHLRNGGDGPARRVQAHIERPASLIYVPNSTTVNDVPLRDKGAQAPFAADLGIVFSEVDPGIEATIRWRDVVHNELPAGESIACIATVRYDGDRCDEIVSNDLKVRATPSFANTIPGLPFVVDGMLGPAFAAAPRALEERRYVELPPATPVNGDAYQGTGAPLDEPPRVLSLEAQLGDEEPTQTVHTLVAFTPERLTRTLRLLLDELDDTILVSHLFTIRAFLPDVVGDLHGGSFGGVREALREQLDRLFIMLRIPSYAMTVRDLESAALRGALERALLDIAAERSVPTSLASATLVLRGRVDAAGLRDAAEQLREAVTGGALVWAALARLLPNESPESKTYRDALVAALDELSEPEPTEFIDALQRHSFPALDAARSRWLASLAATTEAAR